MLEILDPFPQVVRKMAVVCEIQNSSDLAKRIRVRISEMSDMFKSIGLEEFFDDCVRMDVVEGCCGIFTTNDKGDRKIETECHLFNKFGFCPVAKDKLLFKLNVMQKLGLKPQISKLRIRALKVKDE